MPSCGATATDEMADAVGRLRLPRAPQPARRTHAAAARRVLPSPAACASPSVQKVEDRKWEPLYRLSKLSNEDKHQTLATVASVVDEVAVVAAREADVSFTKVGTGRPLGAGDTHVVTIEVDEDSVVKSALPTFVYKVPIAVAKPMTLNASLTRCSGSCGSASSNRRYRCGLRRGPSEGPRPG
jgi:hypothetical protein